MEGEAKNWERHGTLLIVCI